MKINRFNADDYFVQDLTPQEKERNPEVWEPNDYVEVYASDGR